MNLNNLDRTYDYEIFILEEVRVFALFVLFVLYRPFGVKLQRRSLASTR